MTKDYNQQIEISTHSLLAEGDKIKRLDLRQYGISTHSLLAEGDSAKRGCVRSLSISTHSLLAEGDVQPHARAIAREGFQPTPSSRRETPALFA